MQIEDEENNRTTEVVERSKLGRDGKDGKLRFLVPDIILHSWSH
jgi:hypothetical protein